MMSKIEMRETENARFNGIVANYSFLGMNE